MRASRRGSSSDQSAATPSLRRTIRRLARRRGAGRQHLRGLEARRGDSRGFGPQHAAVVAQRLQRGRHGGAVLRLRQGQVERARARRAGQRQIRSRPALRVWSARRAAMSPRRPCTDAAVTRIDDTVCADTGNATVNSTASTDVKTASFDARKCMLRSPGAATSGSADGLIRASPVPIAAETGRRMTGGYAGAPCPGQKPDSGGRPLGGVATATPCLGTSQPFAASTAAARSCSMACRNGASVVTICAKIFGLPAITWPPCR